MAAASSQKAFAEELITAVAKTDKVRVIEFRT